MHKHATANRSFRLVWSAARGAYVVAPETAGGRCKSSASGSGQASRLASAVAFAAGIAWCGGQGFGAAAQVLPAPASVVPTGGNTKAYTNPNGVPVVNIATANAAGLSSNQYTSYNVNPNGLVLNNIANASGGRSDLAGQVQGNLNLNAPARVILNQVVAPNRSMLAGFTEVLGNKADVIVANPYGITCGGCGFINTDRVTLTTGLPTISANGSLTGFSVTGGDILVNGTGLNATAQQVLDLVTRSVRLDGQVNAAATGVIGVTTGNNQWNYGSRSVTGSTAGSGAAPSFAIDSTALGGMYAGRIQLIATEAGVGVRMLGEAAASTDDFTLSSAGKIDLRSKIATRRDLTLTTTSTGADAIRLSDAQLSATRNLQLQAATGGATINGGVLVAGGNLGLSLATLSDIQSGAAITDNNKRFGDTVNIATTGAAALDGTTWGAAKTLGANAASLDVGTSGATLSAGTTLALATNADMNLGKATVWSSGDMSLAAAAGTIRTAAGGQGVESKTGKLDITAGTGLDNKGAIAASGGAMTVRVNGTLDNAGTLYSKSSMAISDKAGGATENIVNSGTLLADGTLNAKAAQATNSGNLQGTGGTTLTANSLDNSGKFIASSAAGTSATLNLATLNNSAAGTVQSSQDLALNVSSSLTNAGNVIAGRNLGITSTGSALALTNQSGGTLQAGAASGSTLSVAGPAVTLNNNAGAKMLGDKFTVTAATVANDGTLQGGTGASTLAVAGTLANSGTITLATTAAGSGSVSANLVNNSGTIQSTGAATLGTATALNNTVTGKILANQLAVTAATLANAGVLQGGAGASTLNVTNTLTNAATGTLTLATDASGSGTITANALTNDGTLQSSGAATLTVATALNNNATGKILAGTGLTAASAGLNNAGVLQGGNGASTLNVTNTLSNSGTLTLATAASGGGAITADTITNSGTLQSTGSADLKVATALNNTAAGRIMASANLTVRGTDAAYAVDNQGLMQSDGALDVKGQAAANGVTIAIGGSGKMLGQTVAFNTQNLAIANGSSLGSTGDMTVAANTLTLGGSAAMIHGAATGGNTTITTTNAFSNPGAIHSGGNLVFNAPSVNNTSTGGMSALGNMTVTASTGDISNSGALYAGGTLTASAAGRTITNVGTLSGQVGTMDSGGDMNLTAGSFINNSAVRAGRSITVNAGTFKNEVAGGDTRTTVTGPMSAKESLGITWHDWAMYDNAQSGISNTEHFRQTWTETTTFANGQTPSYTPQVTAGTAITIEGITGDASGNRGATISAPTVTIRGAAGSKFANDSLASGAQTYQKTWDEWDLCVGYTCANLWVTDQKRLEVARQLYGNVTTTPLTSGIYARTFDASGFELTNITGAYGAGPVAKTATPVGGSNLAGTTTLAGATTAVINVSPVGGVSSITFGGIVIQLPTSPNGYFVMNPDRSASYLVETNPLFATVTNLYGSAYLADQFKPTPDMLTKRLGDANYEAYLIRQQLIAQTGNNLLAGYEKESDLLKDLMEKGAVEASRLELTWGSAPTNDKLADLRQDLVWMVYVEVNGQRVLTPVVYLSQETVAGIQTGAVIQAKNITMKDMASVTNTGGTIIGSETLTITASGNIENRSGTIQGGNVDLKSTSGSIINETVATSECDDNASSCRTVIGKTAGIEATGSLTLDAGQDIRLKGAVLTAGGDATLTAGKDILIETIVDKTRDTTYGRATDDITPDTTRDASQRNYSMARGFEESASGTAVVMADNRDISRGAVGFEGFGSTTTKNDKETHTGSLINVGKNLTLTAKNGDITVKGSDVTARGDVALDAKTVNVIAVEDKDITTTTAIKTSYGIFADGKSVSSVEAGASAVLFNAKEDAGYKTESEGVVTLGKRVETMTKTDTNITNKGSKISSGNNVTIKAVDTATFAGAQVTARNDLTIDAKDIANKAVEDVHSTETSWTQTTSGLSIDAKFDSQGYERAHLTTVGGTPGVGAKALADGKLEIGIGMRTNDRSGTISEGSSTVLGNQFSAGNDFARTAANTIKDEATAVVAGRNITQSAKTIEDVAVSDKAWKNVTETNKDERSGLYMGTWGEAIVGAQANMKTGSAANAGAYKTPEAKPGGVASVSPTLDATIGYRNTAVETTKTKESQLELAAVSKFKAGSSITSTSTDKTTLSGAVFDAGSKDANGNISSVGSVNITAGELEFKAAENKATRTSSMKEEKLEGRAGVALSAGMKVGQDVTLTLGVMGEVIQGFETLGISEVNTAAVAGAINSTGSVTIRATGAPVTQSVFPLAVGGGVRLVGTNITANGDVDVSSDRGNVKLDAAVSTDTKTGSGVTELVKGRAKIGVGVSSTTLGTYDASVGGELSTGNNLQSYTNSSGTGANITSTSGKIQLTAGNQLTTQGAKVEAKVGDVEIRAEKGIVLGEAVHSTTLLTQGHSSFSTAGVSSSPTTPINASAATGITTLMTASTSTTGTASTITSGSKNITLASTAGGITSQEAVFKASETESIQPSAAMTTTKLTNQDTAVALSVDVYGVVSYGVPTLATRLSEPARVVDQNVAEIKNRMEVERVGEDKIQRDTRAPLAAPVAQAQAQATTTTSGARTGTALPSTSSTAPGSTATPAPAVRPAAPPVNTAMPDFVAPTALAPKTTLVAPEARETPEARVQAPRPGTAPQVKVAVVKPVIKASQVKVPPRAPRNPRGKLLEATGAGQATTAAPSAPSALTPVSANQTAAPVTVSAKAAPL